MKQLIRWVPLLGLMAVAGCETMQGAGRDMQTAGQMMTQQSANAQTQMGQPPAPAYAPPVAVTPAPY